MIAFQHLQSMMTRAKDSAFSLWLLNLALGLVVPFNRPHGFAIERIEDGKIVTRAPYRRRNHNHIRGIHACAIATIAEFSSGLTLLTRLDPAQYRLIMARIEIDYLFQAKQEILAETVLEESAVQSLLATLEQDEAATITQVTEVVDRSAHSVARAQITWQIKPWSRVRTQAS